MNPHPEVEHRGDVHETIAGIVARDLDADLLQLALTHRSFAFEAGGLPHNERLEFLGDAVVGLVVTDLIFRRFPDEPEGRLAKLRAAVVSTASLAVVGRELGVGRVVRLGVGEEATGGRGKESILADTFEAVIGAVYLDLGMEAAFAVVDALLGPVVARLAVRRESLDWKTSLQELTAANLGVLPYYALSEEGPDHRKRFTAVASVDGEELGRGEGPTKKAAEQAAAEESYAVLRARLAADAARDEAPSVVAPSRDDAAPGRSRSTDTLTSGTTGTAPDPDARGGGR